MTCGQAIRDLRQAAISEGHPLGTSWEADEAEKALAQAIDASQQEAYAQGRQDQRESDNTELAQARGMAETFKAELIKARQELARYKEREKVQGWDNG